MPGTPPVSAPEAEPSDRPVAAKVPAPERREPSAAQKATRFVSPDPNGPHVITGGRVTPPERIDTSGAWNFTDLSSACPHESVDAARRLDPYWDSVWDFGSNASWLTPDKARRRAGAGLGRIPRGLDLGEDEAYRRVVSMRGWRERLALLGSVFAWRTLTAEQAAAFTGSPRLASTTGPEAAAMFASGLIELGVFSDGLTSTSLTGRDALYRPSRSNVFESRLTDDLTWAEWIAVTGAQPWTGPTTYDRHNVLATELGLRLAEYADIGTVLGERFSTVDLLAGSGIGRDPVVADQRAADMTVVRPDGMRIAVEITATHSSHFFEKVAKWARLLAERPFGTSGLCVVFVVAENPDRFDQKDGHRTRARTYQAIAAATKEFPGTVRDRVAERMGVATWREWFPARGKVNDAFMAMRVDRPTGTGAHMWEPCDMLDPASRPFTPADSFNATAVLDNSALLGGTPHWIRDRYTPPQLWRLLISNAGLSDLPSPTPVRPNRTKGRALGEGVGSVGAAKPPSRLLGLG
ncbi:hypothetical protein GCM10027273_11820 [Nocardioides pakistanensis]